MNFTKAKERRAESSRTVCQQKGSLVALQGTRTFFPCAQSCPWIREAQGIVPKWGWGSDIDPYTIPCSLGHSCGFTRHRELYRGGVGSDPTLSLGTIPCSQSYPCGSARHRELYRGGGGRERPLPLPRYNSMFPGPPLWLHKAQGIVPNGGGGRSLTRIKYFQCIAFAWIKLNIQSVIRVW